MSALNQLILVCNKRIYVIEFHWMNGRQIDISDEVISHHVVLTGI